MVGTALDGVCGDVLGVVGGGVHGDFDVDAGAKVDIRGQGAVHCQSGTGHSTLWKILRWLILNKIKTNYK